MDPYDEIIPLKLDILLDNTWNDYQIRTPFVETQSHNGLNDRTSWYLTEILNSSGRTVADDRRTFF